uniref:DNA recombination and repair protein Rad51-like C-terminal domain-containing protein n=1 Tax=Acrobeloides nanus TaxID=290746 RepID=A0A914C3V4_9BILA
MTAMRFTLTLMDHSDYRGYYKLWKLEAINGFNRILVKRIHDSDELISALLELEGIAESHTISILIVDSIGCMLSETAFALRDGGYRTQVRVLEILRNLCNKHGITVLLVNNIVKWQDRITPSLGKRWKNNTAISHRIYLTRLPDLGIRYFEIEDKNPITRINFTISEKGFHEKEE